MKTKLKIKTFAGKLLFEHESESNSIKKTLINAVESGAYLRDADLSGADLSGAYLSGADLSGAYLRDADIQKVKEDLFDVLSHLNGEVPKLLESLQQGKINGSVYEGECACLVGTIANIKECAYTEIKGIVPNLSRLIERFFLSIKPGHTPENSKKCKEIEGWILEYSELSKP